MSEINIALTAISAIILFLFGLESFSKEIQRIAGDRFRLFLGKATKIPVVGVLIGALVTSLIQSSSATSVITMGLVNAGVINFKNSLGIIFGANIGTTITAQLVAFKLTNFAPYIIIVGFLISIVRNRWSFVGRTVFYFGFVFFSLNLISQAVAPLQSDPRLISFLTTPQNMFTALMIGAIFTALVQSSSVTTGVAVVFTQSSLMSLDNAIPIIIGANIGTTVTAMLAIINMDVSAKRTAISHLIFNIGGVLLFLPFIGSMANWISQMEPAIALATVHLVFNLITCVVFTVFITPYSNFIYKIFPSADNSDLPTFEFPSLKDEINLKDVNSFLKKSFKELLKLLQENYNLATLSIESNYRHIYEKVNRRTQYVDQIQKNFTRFFSELINFTDDQEESQKILIFINEYEYLYQVHDSLKDILEIKTNMDEMYIELHTDMILHYREISSRTLNVFNLLVKKLQREPVEDNDLKDEFHELQKELNEFSRALFKIMPDTNRNDTGNNMHFMTYSQRLKDKLNSLFELLKQTVKPK